MVNGQRASVKDGAQPLASPIWRTPSARPSLKSTQARAARFRPSSIPNRVRGSGRRYRIAAAEPLAGFARSSRKPAAPPPMDPVT